MSLDKLGKTFKKAREELKLTQKEVALKAQIHYNHLYRIENGKAKPTTAVAERIAKALKIKISLPS
jgi:transcriptional regulator with XRE-family HTH domain